MIAKDIHWSPAWATQFRALSPRAAEMKKRELATLKNPGLSYLPAYNLEAVEGYFAGFEKMTPERRGRWSGLQNDSGLRAPLRRRRRQDALRLRSRDAVAGLRCFTPNLNSLSTRVESAGGDTIGESQRRQGVGQRQRLRQRREGQSRRLGDRRAAT